MTEFHESPFGAELISWYAENKRELPWRNTTDPYRIWISEIILQQTRVAQGLDYYNRFMERFPTVMALAEARQEEVMRYWQGLGYYSRARNLHAAACEIMSRFSGLFPVQYADVLSLKGIGEYTAAAICSFAYKQPFAVVDGNVYRVLSRLMDVGTPIDSVVGKKEFSGLAQSVLDLRSPDIYNQAIMEFGALQCTPKSPRCESCPLQLKCLAFARGKVNQLPVKQGKTVVKERFFNYLVFKSGDTFWLRQRNEKDIWKNLFEFPLVETDRAIGFDELCQTPDFKILSKDCGTVSPVLHPLTFRHVLSHRIIHATFYTLKIGHEGESLNGFHKTTLQDIDRFAISRLTELYLEKSSGVLF